MMLAHPAADLMKSLNVCPPLAIHRMAALVVCLYPVEHEYLQIGISIQFTCFLIVSSSVTRTENRK
jgi:hypothetical protein